MIVNYIIYHFFPWKLQILIHKFVHYVQIDYICHNIIHAILLLSYNYHF